MPYNRPDLQRLQNRTRSDIDTSLDTEGTRVSRSVEAAVSNSVSGASHGLHGNIEYVSTQSVPDDELDEPQLIRWCAVFGIFRTDAIAAEGITLGLTGTPGTVIPLNTQWSQTNGATYSSLSEVTIDAGGLVDVAVKATEKGVAGNVEGGATVSLTSPIAGADADAIVAGTVGVLQGTGADVETLESLQARLSDRLKNPPRGGTEADFVFWAKLAGPTRAWAIPHHFGPGSVLIVSTFDSFDEEGNFVATTFPEGATLATIQTSLDTNAPVPSAPTAITATALPMDPDITLVPNTTSVRQQVELQLNDLILRSGGPEKTITLSEINEAISQAPGEVDHTLNSPTVAPTATAIQVHTLGTITWS